MSCTVCNKEIRLFRHTVCKKCYYDYYCSFCKELILKKDCPGHEINTPTTNRFMSDSQFTNDLMFEMEQ